MRHMDATILRLTAEPPDSSEIRHYLRHAATLVAAADLETAERRAILRRARSWPCGHDLRRRPQDPRLHPWSRRGRE